MHLILSSFWIAFKISKMGNVTRFRYMTLRYIVAARIVFGRY